MPWGLNLLIGFCLKNTVFFNGSSVLTTDVTDVFYRKVASLVPENSESGAEGKGRKGGRERRGNMSVKTRTSSYMQPTASTRSKARAPTPRMSPRDGVTSVTKPADDEHCGYGTTATKVVRDVVRAFTSVIESHDTPTMTVAWQARSRVGQECCCCHSATKASNRTRVSRAERYQRCSCRYTQTGLKG